MSEALDSLDRLIDQLSGGTNASLPAAARGDAIDQVLADAPRSTQVPDLRHHPVVEQFRQDLVDGLIRVDTVRRLLDLVNVAVGVLLNR